MKWTLGEAELRALQDKMEEVDIEFVDEFTSVMNNRELYGDAAVQAYDIWVSEAGDFATLYLYVEDLAGGFILIKYSQYRIPSCRCTVIELTESDLDWMREILDRLGK